MRGTITKRILNVFGMTALAILLLACYDELQNQEQKNKATVSFSVVDSVARTTLPQVSLADVASYKLLGGINSAAETELDEFATEGTTVSLEAGRWNFTLNAYNISGDHILQGRAQNQQISLTGTNQVTFSLSVMNTGTGTIQITLNFPESAGITQIRTNGDIGSENFTPAGSGSFVYTKTGIAAGDKLIHFELYRGDVLKAVVSEEVVVRNNLTSSTTITLVGDNLKPLPIYGIVIDLAETNEWKLTEQTAQATPNTDKVFAVTETYATYQWYLDGVLQVETSKSYTLNKPAGVYHLIAVVTNSAGESRSGRCRITVAPPLAADVLANNGIFDANGEDWYSFPVTSGETYRIWWNDSNQGNGTKNGDIAVGARYENATTFIFGGTDTGVDDGWTTAQSFTANQNGTVYIRVIPYGRDSANTGTYCIGYSTSSIRPGTTYTVTFSANGGGGTITQAVPVGSSVIFPDGSGLSRSGYTFICWSIYSSRTETAYNAGSSYIPTGNITFYARWNRHLTINEWAYDSITVFAEQWYSFPVTQGTTYRIWWDDSGNNGTDKTGDIAVSARYTGSSGWIFERANSGWNSAQSFTANQTGTVEIMVTQWTLNWSQDSGTYGIVYSTDTSRPSQ